MITVIHPSFPFEQEAKYFVTLFHSSPNNAPFNEEKTIRNEKQINNRINSQLCV
jgi:hypothetical protein